MKTLFKITLFTFLIINVCNIPAFATNTNKKVATYMTSSNSNAKAHAYIEKANSIRAEIDNYTSKIKELNIYNTNVQKKLAKLNEKYKTNNNSVLSDTMKQIKELRKSLKQKKSTENSVTEKSTIKSLLQEQKYDEALEKLNKILETKKIQFEAVKNKNEIYRQIEKLIDD